MSTRKIERFSVVFVGFTPGRGSYRVKDTEGGEWKSEIRTHGECRAIADELNKGVTYPRKRDRFDRALSVVSAGQRFLDNAAFTTSQPEEEAFENAVLAAAREIERERKEV